MELSVIIVNFNNRELLQECIASVEQTTTTQHEILIVDNASRDGSVEMVRKIFPKARVIANTENLGFIRAANQGLKDSQGNFQLLLNDDAKVHPRSLDTLVEFLQRTPAAGACGPQLLNIDGSIQRQGGLLGAKFWKSQETRDVSFVIGACLLVRKEVIQKVGLMDENLFFYNDDLDWCLRIRKAGWKIYIVPEAKVTHYGGYSSRRRFNKRLFVEGFRGGLYFCRKHYGEIPFHIYRFLLCAAAPIASSLLWISQPFRPEASRDEIPEKLRAYMEIAQIALKAKIPQSTPK